jgi:hypothetical protein
VRGDKQKAAGKKARACRNRRKQEKKSSKREREEGRMSEEGLNPFRKSFRTERSPSRSEEGNESKEIEKKNRNRA